MEQTKRINQFRMQYDYLSNFYPACVTVDGLTYLNAEAAFQASKCVDLKDREQFCELTPDQAKRLGRRIQLRQDWEKVKVSVMKKVVRAKFTQNPHLAEFLVETGDAELVEGNNWHDTIWGVDLKTGEGQNNLGKILMDLRDDFKVNGLPDGSESHDIRMENFPDAISVRLQDISQINYECIVNAADEKLSGEGGVDAAIHRAAGSELLEECRMLHGCRITEAKLTGGCRLKAKYIIHTVGPHYGQQGDAALLELTYHNVLDLARDYGIHSIAFPAISCGKFSYPKKAGTEIAVRAVRGWKKEHLEYDMEVIFTTLDLSVYNFFCQALENR
ncbi:MAG: macro domain-containing protein [Clostridiales bacterium]|nr:macro domain-containing protein [Clostridiales bacterium]